MGKPHPPMPHEGMIWSPGNEVEGGVWIDPPGYRQARIEEFKERSGPEVLLRCDGHRLEIRYRDAEIVAGVWTTPSGLTMPYAGRPAELRHASVWTKES